MVQNGGSKISISKWVGDWGNKLPEDQICPLFHNICFNRAETPVSSEFLGYFSFSEFFFSLNSRNLVDVLSHLDKWRRLKIGIYILLIMHDITEKYSLRLENVLVAMLSSSTYIDYHSSSKILRTSHIEEEHASREKTLSMAINLFSCTKMYIGLDSKRQKPAH